MGAGLVLLLIVFAALFVHMAITAIALMGFAIYLIKLTNRNHKELIEVVSKKENNKKGK